MIASVFLILFSVCTFTQNIGQDLSVPVTANTPTDVSLTFKEALPNLVPLHNSISIASAVPVSVVILILDSNDESIYTKTVEGTMIFEYNIYLEQTSAYKLWLTSNVTTTLKVLVEPLHQEYLGAINIRPNERVVYIKEFLTLESATILLTRIPSGVTVHYTVCNGIPSNPVLTPGVCSSSAKVVASDGQALFFFHAKTVFPTNEQVGSNIWLYTFEFDLPSSLTTAAAGSIAFFSVRKLDSDTVTNITYPLQLDGKFVSISAFDSISVVYKSDVLVTPQLLLEVSLPSEFIITSICVSPISPFNNCAPVKANSASANLSIPLLDFKPSTLYYLAVFCVLTSDRHESTVGITSVKLTMATEIELTSVDSTSPAVYKMLWYDNTVYDKLFSPSRQVHLKFTIPSTGLPFEGADIYIDYHPADPTEIDSDGLCRYSTRITSADTQTIYYYDILHNMHVYKARPGTYYIILHPHLMCLNTGKMSVLEATVFIKRFSTETSFNQTQLIERHQLTAGLLFAPIAKHLDQVADSLEQNLLSLLTSFSAMAATEELTLFYNREYADDNIICFELALGSPVDLLISEVTRYATFVTNQSVYIKSLSIKPNCFSVSKSATNMLSDSALSTVLKLRIHSTDTLSTAVPSAAFFCVYSLPAVIKEYIIMPPNPAFSVIFPDRSKMVMSFRTLSSLISSVKIKYSVFIVPVGGEDVNLVPTTLCGALTAITHALNPAWRRPIFNLTNSVETHEYIVITIPLSQFPIGTNPLTQEYNAFVIVEDILAGTIGLYISSRIKYAKIKLTKPIIIQLSISCCIIVLSVIGIIITAIFCGRMLNMHYRQKRILV
ncbi:Hypothetical protein GLP15_1377 [Giardia lamblia P15]|uniref:Uncharacterized protein n=1 Tax=Giardia intestinalis (strain P15) TaxID=658858 RepID=E1EZB0_GIAIA|nr:Hypothetical protein GLP15_1377 [Giardia lamblia P15]